MKPRTERARVASIQGPIGQCHWIVYPSPAFADVDPVQVYTGTERAAYRVAEAEHPGVPFISAEPGRISKSR